jgi:hypothetical protein
MLEKVFLEDFNSSYGKLCEELCEAIDYETILTYPSSQEKIKLENLEESQDLDNKYNDELHFLSKYLGIDVISEEEEIDKYLDIKYYGNLRYECEIKHNMEIEKNQRIFIFTDATISLCNEIIKFNFDDKWKYLNDYLSLVSFLTKKNFHNFAKEEFLSIQKNISNNIEDLYEDENTERENIIYDYILELEIIEKKIKGVEEKEIEENSNVKYNKNIEEFICYHASNNYGNHDPEESEKIFYDWLISALENDKEKKQKLQNFMN